jgi:nucleotide-binding universal stress UspA family protein
MGVFPMRKVLLAVDGSVHAKEAAQFLSRLPHEARIHLIVMSVVQRPMVSQSYVSWEQLEAIYQHELERSDATYQEIAELFEGANVEIQHERRDGNVSQTIVEFADESNCDLIVLGAKGHSQVHRMLLGSVSDYVATHASCSVLVVRSPFGGQTHANQPLRIVIGCDGSEPAIAGLEEVAEIPWGKTVEMNLLSVAPFLYDFFGELNPNAEVLTRYESVLAEAKRQLSDSTSHSKLRPAKTHLIEREHVGEGIVEFAEQFGCDLMVIGETPRTSLSRLLMGSVSRYVLRHVPCSVWIARNYTHRVKNPRFESTSAQQRQA